MYSDGAISGTTWINGTKDNARYSLGNCYETIEDVEQAIEILKIHNELKRYAEEHNEAEVDWSNDNQAKYFLQAEFKDGNSDIDIEIDCFYNYKNQNQISFTSYEIAEDAIKAIGENRVKMWLKA